MHLSNVLLINPPSDSPNPVMPLGLAYLAAALEEKGIAVEVYDAWGEGGGLADIADQCWKVRPDIVGITMMSPTYGASMQVVDVVHRCCDAIIVVGGPHPSALPEQCLKDNAHIDFVVIGEGEEVLPKLVKILSDGDTDQLNGLDGVAFRMEDGSIVNNGRAPRITNLDEIPFPARHLFPVRRYKSHPPFGKRKPYMTVITSRGCSYQCTYCSKAIFGRRFRARSPENVIAEIKFLKEKFAVRELHFYDDDFTMDMKRAERICDLLIQERVSVSWSCTTRVNLVTKDLLAKMKKAGCWLICYGVESSDPEILKRVKKGYTVEQINAAFSWTRDAGIKTVGFFMLGLPGETEKTMRGTIDFSLNLAPDFVSWGITALYPGSTLYEEAVNGCFGDVNVSYSLEQDKSGGASGSPFGAGYAIVLEENFSRDELWNYAQQANRRFYLRCRYLLKMIFGIRSLSEAMHYIRGGIQVLLYSLNIKDGVGVSSYK